MRIVSLFLLFFLAGSVLAEECALPLSCDTGVVCVYLFYGSGCSHCANVKPLVDELKGKYYNVVFYELEIYHNQSNYELFLDFNERFGIKKSGVPTLFIGNTYLSGDRMIESYLQDRINYFLYNNIICPLDYNRIFEGSVHDISPRKIADLTFLSVVSAALVDSVNPCAFAVLVFLIIYLMTVTDKKRVLKIGVVYISVVFLVYFLSGLGLFAFVQSANITRVLFYISAFISIIAGLINIKDFFFFGRGFSLTIPQSKKHLISRYVKRASFPAAVILGILVSMFELPCTGGVYLAILSLLASGTTLSIAVSYLLLYNIIFISPLFIILFAVYFGFSPERIDNWRLKKRRWLRLVMGVVMMLIGILMLSGFFR